MPRALPAACAALLLCLAACSAAPPAAPPAPPTPYGDPASGLWGYRYADGTVAVAPRFAVALAFHAPDAAFAVDDHWACIDARGREKLAPFVFDNGPDPFSEGLARFVDGGRVGFFDVHCDVVIPAEHDFAEPFSGGVARYCDGCTREYSGEHWTMTGGAWGCMDRGGATVPCP